MIMIVMMIIMTGRVTVIREVHRAMAMVVRDMVADRVMAMVVQDMAAAPVMAAHRLMVVLPVMMPPQDMGMVQPRATAVLPHTVRRAPNPEKQKSDD